MQAGALDEAYRGWEHESKPFLLMRVVFRIPESAPVTLHPLAGYLTGWSMLLDYVVNPLICTIWCASAARASRRRWSNVFASIAQLKFEGVTHYCHLDPTDPKIYQFFTYQFMHGDAFHLIGNMWFLWLFGNNVEDSMGHLRFVAFYLLCGVAGAVLIIAGMRGGRALPPPA